jgi:hypothetical protein
VCSKEKKYFVLVSLELTKQDKKISCISMASRMNHPKKDLFHLYYNLPQFKQSAGDTPLWSLCSIDGQKVEWNEKEGGILKRSGG